MISCDDPASLGVAAGGHSMAGSKQWITVPVPHVYVGTNWPIRVGPGRGGRRVGVGTLERLRYVMGGVMYRFCGLTGCALCMSQSHDRTRRAISLTYADYLL